MLGTRWQSAAWLLCLFILDLPQAPLPCRRVWLCQIVLPVRAEPDRLVLGLERLRAPEEEAGGWQPRGPPPALLRQGPAVREAGLDSAILSCFENQTTAPGAHPKFLWGASGPTSALHYVHFGAWLSCTLASPLRGCLRSRGRAPRLRPACLWRDSQQDGWHDGMLKP